jgi:hypothetical protein
LAALLRDEEYGAKLARLGRADERIVLDLVYEGRGREARQAIIELDEARRRHRTYWGYAKVYARLPKPSRTTEWRRAMNKAQGHEKEFWNLYRAAVLAPAA